MALGAESVVSHWSVTELRWPDATGSKSRVTSRPDVASPSAVSAASRQLPVSLVSPLARSLLPGSFPQAFGPRCARRERCGAPWESSRLDSLLKAWSTACRWSARLRAQTLRVRV